jgi:CelD/BcsL family acetyltransferase involved in cellulose biosynthesis
LQIVVHRIVPQEENLRQQWNQLVHRCESPQIFYTHEWASAVASAYASSVVPLLVLGYESGRLLGVASLATGPHDRPACFLASTTADYCDFVSTPDVRTEFMHAVFGEIKRREIRALALANLPADSLTAQVLQRVSGEHGYHVFQRPAYACAQVQLGSAGERLLIQQSIRKRKAFRQALNALARRGTVSFRHHDDGKSAEELFPEFARAHIARFHAHGKLSNLDSAERRNFLLRLAVLLSPEGWFRFSCMRVGDKPVAWNFGFHFAGSWFYYQPTFVSDVQEFSPGVCLLSKLIEDACVSSDTQVVDLGIGAEGYKERFANAQRATIHVEVSRSIVRRSSVALRYYAAASAKSVPAVESGVRAGLRAISRLSKYKWGRNNLRSHIMTRP